MSNSNCHVSSTVKHYPVHPYADIKQAILGKSFQLTLVFVGPKRAAQLNTNYRKKTYSPNVLSFPLDEKTGEIFICPAVARKEAHEYNLTPAGYIAFLFIHGLLHLKGHDHGATMEALERRYVKRFAIA